MLGGYHAGRSHEIYYVCPKVLPDARAFSKVYHIFDCDVASFLQLGSVVVLSVFATKRFLCHSFNSVCISFGNPLAWQKGVRFSKFWEILVLCAEIGTAKLPGMAVLEILGEIELLS